jgi:hypothetical protein
MTHFTVLVCLPNDFPLRNLAERLEDVMAPWNENLSVEPHRSYEQGTAENHWWVSSIRQGAEKHKTLTEGGVDAYIDRYVPQQLATRRDWGMDLHAKVKASVEMHAPGWAEDAEWAAKLPDPVTWQAVVELYNAKFHPATALAVVDDKPDAHDDNQLHYDPQIDRAFTWSTRNPNSKWDYWSIGGRWHGHFIAKRLGAGLISGHRCSDSPNQPVDNLLRCDGGPKGLLDFEAMRAANASRAHDRYDRWEAVCKDTPVAKPWSYFAGLVEAQAATIEEAREQYQSQPRIQKARTTQLDDTWGGCVVEEFLPDRDEYVTQARAAAVPGYALVTLDGQWLAPGQMGWFGMSSDGPGERQAYHVAANRYLDDLKDDHLVVLLDCHI